jgi:pyruvate kinase
VHEARLFLDSLGMSSTSTLFLYLVSDKDSDVKLLAVPFLHACIAAHLCREDVREARLFLDSLGMSHTKVLAKVETRQALLNFRGILGAADGIVMSR